MKNIYLVGAYFGMKDYLIAIIVFALSLFVATAGAEPPWHQEPLEKAEKLHKCEPVSPQLIRGQPSVLDTDEYYVNWCVADIPGNWGRYQLILVTQYKRHDWASCSKLIPVMRDEPHELWTIRPKFVNGLESFWYVGENPWLQKKFGPTDVKAKGLHLYFGWRGASGQILYCHEGEWLMDGFH